MHKKSFMVDEIRYKQSHNNYSFILFEAIQVAQMPTISVMNTITPLETTEVQEFNSENAKKGNLISF